ncbi:HAD hydrolase-like protein [Candidatus Woesebacteria bacterium]|nr:HAD hydrolase-like protein [Candidatus Woesebacteria bacterium]
MEKQQYILTQDTQALFAAIDPRVASSEQFSLAAEEYVNTLSDALSPENGGALCIRTFYEQEINARLQEAIIPFLQTENTICICLDRFLLSDIDQNEEYKGKFARFSMARAVDGTKVPRQGNPSFEKQIQEIAQIAQGKQVVIVDDGFFTGGTIRDFMRLAEESGVDLPIQKIIGFIGNGVASEEPFTDKTEILEPVQNLYEWIDIRDFGPFGGKRYEASRQNGVTSAIPYIYPWSDGSGASLNMSPRFFDISQSMIKAFQSLVTQFEAEKGCSLRMRDIVNAGFPLPTNAEKSIPVSINDSVTRYLDRCLTAIETERQRKTMIFDMDGTLYQIDGSEKGFAGSTLEQAVLENAKNLIREREQITEDEVYQLVNTAQTDPIGMSRFLSERYGVTREEYFNSVWDIDPEGIVQNFDIPVSVLRELTETNPEVKYILLTAAPRIWAEKVLNYIGVSELFEVKYTGDQFGTKAEIFEMLAGRYQPENIISVGDQEQTDIIPAQKYGISGILVQNPPDLLRQLQERGEI